MRVKSKGRFAVWALALGLMALLFASPEASIESIRRGMSLCVRTMIPSLFPFMVVSELVVRSGAGEAIAHLPARLFSLPRSGVCACLLGLLCGFPVGSRAAAEYCRRGSLTAWQFNVVLSCCNVPSSAFLACAVGVSLFGSREVGRILIVLSLVSALSSGLVTSLLLPRDRQMAGEDAPFSVPTGQEGRMSASHLIPQSISSAAQGMLTVCATVLVFSAVMGAMSGLLEAASLGDTGRALLLGFFEMSGGVCAASLLWDSETALLLCAAMIGWGGLSVHCQIFSVCGGCPLRAGVFWLGRLWQMLVCVAGMYVWLRVRPLSLPEMPHPMAWRELLAGRDVPTKGFSLTMTWACGLLFAAGVALLWGRTVRMRGDRR